MPLVVSCIKWARPNNGSSSSHRLLSSFSPFSSLASPITRIAQPQRPIAALRTHARTHARTKYYIPGCRVHTRGVGTYYKCIMYRDLRTLRSRGWLILRTQRACAFAESGPLVQLEQNLSGRTSESLQTVWYCFFYILAFIRNVRECLYSTLRYPRQKFSIDIFIVVLKFYNCKYSSIFVAQNYFIIYHILRC